MPLTKWNLKISLRAEGLRVPDSKPSGPGNLSSGFEPRSLPKRQLENRQKRGGKIADTYPAPALTFSLQPPNYGMGHVLEIGAQNP